MIGTVCIMICPSTTFSYVCCHLVEKREGISMKSHVPILMPSYDLTER